MKRKYLLVLSLLMLTGLFGCGKDTSGIESVAKGYLETSLAYNFNEAKKYATGEALEAMNLVESYLSYSNISAVVKSVEILDTDTDGKYAKVKAIIVRDAQADDVTETENRSILVELINSDGNWLVYNSTVLKFGS